MEQFIGYIATGVVSLVVGLLLQRLQAKPRLLYWVPGSFMFNLKEPKLALRTDSLTIQNDGRLPATNVEIIHKQRPDHFQFSTAISYVEDTGPDGCHIIKIPSLGAKEFVNIQLLSHIQEPVLLNVRSAEGPGQLIQVHLQRIYPKWFQVFVALLMLLGFGFLIYWIGSAIVFVSKSIGVA
ncbi:hypothetical protein EZI54_22695 [Marinobacter halodurans]|uniref:DUF3592 domain-containing protein n=1 Tax=Marinobacter halodurans TaxID=2528979 RepID=A0ABY1ZDM2_9GAMM|nr:hypothetical protein [Marinobacter halodurans]TBW47470.1 hypothetical protein EZI54_22695 [Marinobacter halodurans]